MTKIARFKGLLLVLTMALAMALSGCGDNKDDEPGLPKYPTEFSTAQSIIGQWKLEKWVSEDGIERNPSELRQISFNEDGTITIHQGVSGKLTGTYVIVSPGEVQAEITTHGDIKIKFAFLFTNASQYVCRTYIKEYMNYDTDPSSTLGLYCKLGDWSF